MTADTGSYLEHAGGTLAGMIDQGAEVVVLRVTNDDKDSWDLPPEETARRNKAESEDAAKILGVTDI